MLPAHLEDLPADLADMGLDDDHGSHFEAWLLEQFNAPEQSGRSGDIVTPEVCVHCGRYFNYSNYHGGRQLCGVCICK